PQQLAPQVQLTSGPTGDAADLEARIDQAPVTGAANADPAASLKNLFQKNPPRAVLQVHSTERDAGAVFVRVHSVIVFLPGQDWNDAAVRSALADFLRPNLSVGSLGIAWQAGSGEQHLDGLWPLAVAVRAKYLFVSDNLALLNSALANWSQKPA